MKAGAACGVDFSAAAGSEGGSRDSVGFMGPLMKARESEGVRSRSWATAAEDSSAGSNVAVGSSGVISTSGWDSSADVETSTGGGGGGIVGKIGGGREIGGEILCRTDCQIEKSADDAR